MPRKVRELTNMSFDEVSLVDVPANQYANILIAKRATEEDAVPEYFDESGNPITEDDLQPGDILVDDQGNQYEWQIEQEDTPELLEVGKSYSFADQVRDELSKALNDTDRDQLISKAADEIAKADQRAAEAIEIAKAERDLRLEREYVEVAKQYSVPIDPSDLGPVLKRAAEALSYEDCAIIHKALTAAGEQIFQEVGVKGAGSNNDVFSEVEGLAEAAVSKAFETNPNGNREVAKAATVVDLFSNNPAAYDEYLATRYQR